MLDFLTVVHHGKAEPTYGARVNILRVELNIKYSNTIGILFCIVGHKIQHINYCI